MELPLLGFPPKSTNQVGALNSVLSYNAITMPRFTTVEDNNLDRDFDIIYF
jgi:hypothetical protein